MEGSQRSATSAGMLLFTDGLTEARQGRRFFGLDGVTTALRRLAASLGERGGRRAAARSVAEFATDPLTDDLCLLAAPATG